MHHVGRATAGEQLELEGIERRGRELGAREATEATLRELGEHGHDPADAVDDKRSTNPADVKGASNYVHAALSEALAGKPVTVASTSPYGCSVKY